MSPMTIEDLMRILVACAGRDEGVDFRGDLADRELQDLGYDSLALIEAATCIEQEFGVQIPDDTLPQLRTPRSVLAVVNDRLYLAT